MISNAHFIVLNLYKDVTLPFDKNFYVLHNNKWCLPKLFSNYMDDLSKMLTDSGIGCYVASVKVR